MIHRNTPRETEQVVYPFHNAHLAVGIGHHPDLDQRHIRSIGHLQLRHGGSPNRSIVGIGPDNVVSANPDQARIAVSVVSPGRTPRIQTERNHEMTTITTTAVTKIFFMY